MMTLTEIILRTCIEKVSLSKAEADDIVDRKAKQGIVVYYYNCQFCKRYHMSKQDSTVNVVEVV